MRNTKWNIKNMPKEKEVRIDNIPVDKDILKILFSRGIRTAKEIRAFLNPRLENLKDPHSLHDMEKAVDEIRKSIAQDRNIWIYGDYDVDGITSTALLYHTLKKLGARNVDYYIPIRDEGYGLNNGALKKISDSGGELVITVDCGITSFAEVEYAASLGLPVIITDHHNLHGSKIPEALAVINPKRPENGYSFPSLAGVGTVFMLALCLAEAYGKKEEIFEYLDLVSIGTVADIVPLLEENRILVKFGLEQLPYTKNKGLSYLLHKLFSSSTKEGGSKPKAEYSTYDVGFIIAPVFNAAGRLKDAKMAVKLLISDNIREIEAIVTELISKNFERKEIQNRIVEAIEKNIEEKGLDVEPVIVDYSPEYHHGVIGIAAAKIVDSYHKPVIIMEVKEDEGIAIGSCRSIEGFNILSALRSISELFIKFGGHTGAAGFTLPIRNIELFVRKVNEYAGKVLKEEDFIKVINIDKQIPMQKMSYEFFKTIELLKPFGFGNPMPTFQTKNILLENIRYIGENRNHIMFDLKQKGFVCRNAVWFGSGELFKELNGNLFYDVVYKLKVEEFQDRFHVKAYVEDMKVSSLKDERLAYFHSLYSTSFPLKSVFYTRIELEREAPLTIKTEFNQILLCQGHRIVGRLDYSISNLLIQLKEHYNWNFSVKIEEITETATHNIVDILIRRDFSFECYDYTEAGIFKRIKSFLIKEMDYDSFTRSMLSLFFREGKNLILSFGEARNEGTKALLPENMTNFLLTIGIYYFRQTGKKSLIVTGNLRNFPFDTPFVKSYFDIRKKYDAEENSSYPFVLFYDLDLSKERKKTEIPVEYFSVPALSTEIREEGESGPKEAAETLKANGSEEKENLQVRFCFFTEALSRDELLSRLSLSSTGKKDTSPGSTENNENFSSLLDNPEFIEAYFLVPENLTFLNSLKRKEIKELGSRDNIYVEYLPLSEKTALKKKLEEGERIYSDYSVAEIL